MTGTVLGLRELNRATLARQLLLERVSMPVPDLLEHLGGLQAQTPQTWYVGLWDRLTGFAPAHASDLLESRELVRIAVMRGTIHLVTARDALAMRHLFGPALERSMAGASNRDVARLDRDEVAAAGRRLLEDQPMTFSHLGRALEAVWRGHDPASLARAVRASEALAQVTPRGLWGRSGAAAHTPLQSWVGAELTDDVSVDDLVLRYLAAFGPATVKDIQAWSGLTRLAEVVDRQADRLVRFGAEDGRELVDLPGAPRPDPDAPAPVRFLYDFDNLLLSHADRSRVITEGYFRQEFDIHGPMPRLVLVDGFTGAHWTVEQSRAEAILTVHPFGRLTKPDVAAVEAEGAALLGFLAPGVTHDIRVLAPR